MLRCQLLLYLPPCYSFWPFKAISVRLRQTWGLPRGWGSQDFWQSAHEGGKFVRPTHRSPLPPHKISLVLISLRDCADPMAIVCRKNQVNEKSQRPHRESNLRPSESLPTKILKFPVSMALSFKIREFCFMTPCNYVDVFGMSIELFAP